MSAPAEIPRTARATVLLWMLPGLLSIAVVAILMYKAWPLLYPQVVVRAPLHPACDLRGGPCTVAFEGGGEVRLSIEPRQIPLVRPLQLEVVVQDLDPWSVELDFAGVDMNMGHNRVRLEPSGEGRFTGRGMLPVCVRNRMAWEARVLLQTPSGYMAAPFRFETFR